MADATKGSFYDKYWFLIRDHRWKKSMQENPNFVIELEIPAEQQAKVIKMIRNRKWREQWLTGRNYGILFAVRAGNVVRFKLVPPALDQI